MTPPDAANPAERVPRAPWVRWREGRSQTSGVLRGGIEMPTTPDGVLEVSLPVGLVDLDVRAEHGRLRAELSARMLTAGDAGQTLELRLH